ncbi:hypothetical protein NS220_15120 [Microbacterium testaceum]|uniref:Uncharacterized protein n=1 Tax=Microbacterium testaceum TaxID=2033 RepID=A0A147EU14_MICTE|nr:hypothetical protein [Microbacterium testaceum]KTR90505.1 hypothetical protein NS220_15120 [Microbacterium testaceum]
MVNLIAIQEAGTANMVIVTERATILRPMSRLSGAFVVMSLLIVEAVSVGGIYASLAQGRSVIDAVFWVGLGLLFPVLMVLIMSRRLRGVATLAALATEGDRDAVAFLFSSSALATGVESWRDWRNDHATGAGFLLVNEDGLQIRGSADSLIAQYSLDAVTSIEEVRLWSQWLWSPQVRFNFSDGSRFIATLAYSGIRGYFGLGDSGMQKLGVELEGRSPGITRRGGQG